MPINDHENEFITLVTIGAVIAFGKLLVGGEALTIRLVLGRVIVGAGLSASAGAMLMLFKDLQPTALIGLASALGILGQSYLELIAKKMINGGRHSDANKNDGNPS
ncbi:holin [Collimonas sp. NPDC087041]|uniref:holin n=1 Tax=Collimonas sp. NPDC087041 TaxID=3363960 RepID=UPI00381540C8